MMLRYSFPLTPFNELRREVGRLFDEFGTGSRPGGRGLRPFPALNVWDGGDAIFVEAEVPGIGEDDLEIFALGNELTIKGRRTATKDDNVTYHRQERGTGEFVRNITLPVEVDSEKVDASLQNGVLTLRLAKAENAKPRKIPVKVQ